MNEEPVEGTHPNDDCRRHPQSRAPQPKVVGEFEVRERGVALRMRVERWPSPMEMDDDAPLIEAGYGHGV